PDPRPAHRRGRRAHPRLQHGLPRRPPARGRRLRPALPHRRRRRRRLLAPPGAGLDDRLLLGGDGLASPPQLGPRLLPPAARLRARRGTARAEVAREVQLARSPPLGGTRLLARPRGARGPPRPRLSRPLGKRSLPVALPAGAVDALVAVPDAG